MPTHITRAAALLTFACAVLVAPAAAQTSTKPSTSRTTAKSTAKPKAKPATAKTSSKASAPKPAGATATTQKATAQKATAQMATAKPAPVPGANATPALTGDAKEIANYRLTMAALRKMAQVQENMYTMVTANPGLKEKYAKMERDDDEPEPKTLDDMARMLDRVPEMKRAVTSAGFTPREYMVATMAMMQAAMTAGFMEMDGPMKVKEIPPGVLHDNVHFLKANKAELDRMQARARELEKLTKAANGESGEEETPDTLEAPPAR